MPEKDCRKDCIYAGMTFSDNVEIGYFPVNVKGLISEEGLKIPHSELAMHLGAAGRDLMAWSIKKIGEREYSHIIFEDKDNCCQYAHGLPSELLSSELRELMGQSNPFIARQMRRVVAVKEKKETE